MLFDLLYDAVAVGMLAYTRTAFKVETLGGERMVLEPGTILVCTHRADTDVPLVCPSLYLRASLWRKRGRRPHFAAREDVFQRGFFAGFPSGMPVVARRVLFPLGAGPVLRRLPMHPVAHPSVGEVRLARALSQIPAETSLQEVLPGDALEPIRARAARGGVAAPSTAGQALTGRYADLLWKSYSREQLAHPAFELLWRARRAQAAAELRTLVELVRSGHVLFLFPEGRPSPDGSIGPLRGGLGALVRRGAPSVVLPIGVAYDPLTRWRMRAFVAFGEPVVPGEDPDESILAALRRATPLTCGQVVADALVEAATDGDRGVRRTELEQALSRAVDAAASEHRPVEHALRDRRRRTRRLDECLRALASHGVTGVKGGSLGFDARRLLAERPLVRLAREYASARTRARYASL